MKENLASEAPVRLQKDRQVKAPFTFAALFIFCSLPMAISDLADSPAIKFRNATNEYQDIIRASIYMICYLVGLIFPICIFYKYRNQLTRR